MQRIQTFRVFESRVTLTENQEDWLNQCTEGSWSLNPAGEVDVEGNFDCRGMGLEPFQGVKFGRVSGNFDCSNNMITSLEGAPRKVKGRFNCSCNMITSLAGAPWEVGGDFLCRDNRLTSLAGAPREVGGYFMCWDNKLTSLKGAPRKVGEGFSCSDNRLISLKGAPREVGGFFLCENNKLTSLEGAPREVGGGFDCEYNELTSLAGAPQTIGSQFISDMVKIPKGQWGFKGWLDAYVKGNAQARNLLLTLMSPDAINRKMKEAPEQTLIDLGPVWNDPAFDEIRAQIRVPDRYRDEMGLLGDLGELGF